MGNCAKEKMSLSPVELADELSMTRKEYLIVEGESDKIFWEHLQVGGLKKRTIRLANKTGCSGNKEYVKKVISIMNTRNKSNAIGVIDLDYDFVRNTVEEMNNLFYYKYIDLENVLIQSPYFSEINTLISSKQKKMEDLKLKEFLYDKVYILGILRLLNDIEQLNFSFEGLDYKKLLEDSKEKFLEYFMARMNLSKVKREEVVTKVQLLVAQNYDKYYICNGHDLINILSLLTKKKISNDNPILYKEEILQKMLVLGYRKIESAFDVSECSDILLNLVSTSNCD